MDLAGTRVLSSKWVKSSNGINIGILRVVYIERGVVQCATPRHGMGVADGDGGHLLRESVGAGCFSNCSTMLQTHDKSHYSLFSIMKDHQGRSFKEV